MSFNSAIEFNNVSKKYYLGTNHGDTFRDKLSKAFSFKKNEEVEFWALRDLSLEINRGDVYGIIGKNGAGKSTLLKLVSRITYPTSGEILIKGKVASLLEVGTGFHPELTGRENIFLNGSILGMSRTDIALRFDEIVAFSGVEQFLDTPVKHYSSGMYVRLAFAVAAHLEPEILIIDEVLAVGDVDFQKKCLGRMKSVSEEGRTVVFVSHNLPAISYLCNKAIVLSKGQMVFNGQVDIGVSKYLESSVQNSNALEWTPSTAIKNLGVELSSIKIKPSKGKSRLELGDAFSIQFELDCDFTDEIPGLTFNLSTGEGTPVLMTSSYYLKQTMSDVSGAGKVLITCTVPEFFLNEGQFVISKLLIFKGSSKVLLELNDIYAFEIFFNPNTVFGLDGRHRGSVRPLFDWSYDKM